MNSYKIMTQCKSMKICNMYELLQCHVCLNNSNPSSTIYCYPFVCHNNLYPIYTCNVTSLPGQSAYSKYPEVLHYLCFPIMYTFFLLSFDDVTNYQPPPRTIGLSSTIKWDTYKIWRLSKSIDCNRIIL